MNRLTKSRNAGPDVAARRPYLKTRPAAGHTRPAPPLPKQITNQPTRIPAEKPAPPRHLWFSNQIL